MPIKRGPGFIDDFSRDVIKTTYMTSHLIYCKLWHNYSFAVFSNLYHFIDFRIKLFFKIITPTSGSCPTDVIVFRRNFYFLKHGIYHPLHAWIYTLMVNKISIWQSDMCNFGPKVVLIWQWNWLRCNFRIQRRTEICQFLVLYQRLNIF